MVWVGALSFEDRFSILNYFDPWDNKLLEGGSYSSHLNLLFGLVMERLLNRVMAECVLQTKAWLHNVDIQLL